MSGAFGEQSDMGAPERDASAEERSARPALLRVLVGAQVVLVLAAGIAVATRLPIWSFADEREHAAYVDSVSRGRLPLLGRDVVPPALTAVGGSRTGASYEAFQPPLYYVLSAVPWRLARALGGVRFAARTLRLLDLACLAVTLGLLWLLAGKVAGRCGDRLAAFALALTFVAWPGVVARSVTIANTTLEMPLATAALLAMWVAWDEGSSRALLAASLICGLGLLCRLPFPAIVLLPVVAWRFRRSNPRAAVIACLLPLVLVAPWVVDNIHRYGSPTAASLVREIQGPFLNSGDKPYGLTRLAGTDVMLLNGMLPEDWANTTLVLYVSPHSLSLTVLHVLRGVLTASIVIPLGIWLRTGPRRLALLFVPLFIGLLFTQIETVVVRLPFANPRYVYPLLPAFGLAAGSVLVRALGRARTVAVAGTASVALVALWIYLATVPPLID